MHDLNTTQRRIDFCLGGSRSATRRHQVAQAAILALAILTIIISTIIM